MKKILLTSAAAAAMILASCTRENEGTSTTTSSADVAYVSIKLDTRQGTRFSNEADPTDEEKKLTELYLITFDDAGYVMGIPGNTGKYYTFIDPNAQQAPATATSPAACPVAATSKKLLVIANPGFGLKKALDALNSSSSYTTLNAAIKTEGVGIREVADLTQTNRGFTMINAGTYTAGNTHILDPLVDISGKIAVVSDNLKDEDAKKEAEAKRVDVKLERLAAKLVVYAKSGAIKVNGEGMKNDKVTLTDWTVDAVNSTFYPFAEKTILEVTHKPEDGTGDYVKNFYTKDPNFLSDPGKGYALGLRYAQMGSDFEPQLPFEGYYGWKKPANPASPNLATPIYVIENTMDKAHQVYGSATRIIMKATYFPEGYDENKDWFSWAGIHYKTLADLKAAYNNTEAATALRDACDTFMDKLTAAAAASGVTLSTGDFGTLTEGDLDKIKNGGQAVKDGKNPVIRWFQKGLCYYSYEIRHDNETTDSSAFGKYGVVRNNWYDLTLNSVKGPGTPWYPEVTNPGPGDPDPKDPIDMSSGYLGVTVRINKWITWTTEMNDVD